MDWYRLIISLTKKFLFLGAYGDGLKLVERAGSGSGMVGSTPKTLLNASFGYGGVPAGSRAGCPDDAQEAGR